MSREFQIFAKPAGAACNLNCSYCYYINNSGSSSDNQNQVMSDQILEKYIIGHIEATTDDVVMFSWHGGEPLLAGLEFFKKALALQRKHLPHGKTLLNGIQTNGTLLNDEFCRFMTDEGIIAGISIDGPREIHDKNRVNRNNQGSFAGVMKGFELLRKHNITCEILCVVGSHNENQPQDVYSFFRSLGTRYLTFLPLVIKDENAPEKVKPGSVDPHHWGHFLISVFDEWSANDIGKIQIQTFEEATRTAFSREHTLCIFKVNCGGVPVVEKNGDFYSCDHYVNDKHRIGNILDRSVAEMLDSGPQQAFGKAKSLTLPVYCRTCEVLDMCNGECPKNRFVTSPNGEPGLNYLCPGYRKFFNHCRLFIDAVRTVWLKQKT